MKITAIQISQICDYYCRFPREEVTQEQLNHKCDECPLAEVMKFRKGKEKHI